MALDRTRIQIIILRTINDHDVAHWHMIRNEVIAEFGELKDWMEVRNVLQGLINSRYVKKVDSVTIEAYTR
jgi:hypothetical protein